MWVRVPPPAPRPMLKQKIKESLQYVKFPFLLALPQTLVLFAAFMFARAKLSHLVDGHVAGAFGLLPVAFVLATWWIWFLKEFITAGKSEK